MNTSPLPPDPLTAQIARDTQLQAARLAQEAFATAFRLGAEAHSDEQFRASIAQLASHLNKWAGMANAEEQILRRVLLLTGIDQWGLAYSQVFGGAALGGITALIGALREPIRIEDEAHSQELFETVRSDEAAAFDFKVELRRALHLALWHSMIASEDRDEAFAILQALGGMMLALIREMPSLGWRLIADTLALIQIRCLSHALASQGLARETTTELFGALARDLPENVRQAALQAAAEAVLAWQQAQRGMTH
ncbi:MAG: hypothetical protein FWD62_02275 [Betaproteobacteria bacterium]|nr:hypothetical protein [Betaproteobacteria bacterium]